MCKWDFRTFKNFKPKDWIKQRAKGTANKRINKVIYDKEWIQCQTTHSKSLFTHTHTHYLLIDWIFKTYFFWTALYISIQELEPYNLCKLM